MGTPFKNIYAAFLARIEQDTWIFGTDLDYLERVFNSYKVNSLWCIINGRMRLMTLKWLR